MHLFVLGASIDILSSEKREQCYKTISNLIHVSISLNISSVRELFSKWKTEIPSDEELCRTYLLTAEYLTEVYQFI